MSGPITSATAATVARGAMDTQNGTTQNGTAKEAARAQSRAGVISYLSYALDDVGALSPAAVHLLEMAIAILEDPQPERGLPEADQRKLS
jgi:hypothetical protein